MFFSQRIRKVDQAYLPKKESQKISFHWFIFRPKQHSFAFFHSPQDTDYMFD